MGELRLAYQYRMPTWTAKYASDTTRTAKPESYPSRTGRESDATRILACRVRASWALAHRARVAQILDCRLPCFLFLRRDCRLPCFLTAQRRALRCAGGLVSGPLPVAPETDAAPAPARLGYGSDMTRI